MNFVIVCLEVIFGPVTVSFIGVANLERRHCFKAVPPGTQRVFKLREGTRKNKIGYKFENSFFQLVLIWETGNSLMAVLDFKLLGSPEERHVAVPVPLSGNTYVFDKHKTTDDSLFASPTVNA